MNKFRRILGLVMLISGMAFGQATLTQTTLSAAVGGSGQAGYSGVSTTYSTQIFLTSLTNVQSAINGQPQTGVYVDNELMEVLLVPSSATLPVTVLRGQGGTKASAHANAAMVLLGPVNQFFSSDPPVNGACTSTAIFVTPWVNVITSNQWLCSSVTGTWVPGFNNDYQPPVPTAAVASAAGLVTPSGPLFHITGALAITGFNIPVGFSRGSVCVIPDGAFTTTTANNIAIASTAVVSRTNCWTFDPVTTKFYPSY